MNSTNAKLVHLTLLLCLAAATLASTAAAQVVVKPKPPKAEKAAVPVVPRTPEAREMPPVVLNDGSTTEKSIAVDPNANIKICVLEGNLKINGWERPEMRVFVKNGSRVAFRVLEKDPSSNKPVWVLVSNSTSERPGPPQSSECLSGERIEIDVPMKSTLSVAGRATETMIDSVQKVSVKNAEGNISLRNIPGGITASTLQGDVTVENSGGSIQIESSTGNLVAYEVTPGQIGDLFKAKTSSGAISLQKVDHRQIEANSISGSVIFNGKILPGGLYNFRTSNGSIRLLIPDNSSCTIKASYGFGNFNSEIPLKFLYRNVTSESKNLAATLGSGDATIILTTSSGSIGVRKQ
ncbi:MAG: DUF4097 family beta strand repeat-containing protein [Acidobacteriota bacterium]